MEPRMSLENDIAVIKELIESRIDRIDEGFARAKEIYVDSGKMPLAALKRLASKDPTYPQTGKYVEWMAKQYITHRSMRGLDVVAKFDTLCNRNKIEQKDINAYKTIEELHDAVDAQWAREAEERETYKMEQVKAALVKFDGSAVRVMKYRQDLVKDFDLNVEYVNKVRQRMEREKKGIFGKDFTIDTKIINEVDRKPYKVKLGKDAKGKDIIEDHPNGDVVFENDKVIIVSPQTKEKSCLYGRNHLYNPKDPQSLDAPWCTSYTRRDNRWDSYYGRSGNNFYIILPKDVMDVPQKKFTKVNVQVESKREGGDITVWDFSDATVPESEYKPLFKEWGIPLE
jgi:hypothetical protein